MEILLEQVDKVIERTGVTYKEAKEALESCDGNVLDAIIYLEENANVDYFDKQECCANQSIEEFKIWISEIINKGNVTRIKIKKEDKILLDVPVNAGVAALVMASLVPSLFAVCVALTIATKVTVEISFADGTTQVVNKYICEKANDIKEKATSIGEEIKSKIDEKVAKVNDKEKVYTGDETVYTYTVNFDDEK